MKPAPQEDTLTVLYDGGCPLCQREIAHVQRLAQKQSGSGLCFADISRSDDTTVSDIERQALLARFHVQRADGSRLSGAAAFVAMWGRLPGWRWLARLAQLPGMLVVFEWSYNAFLRIRPALQSLARRVAPDAPTHEAPAPVLSLHMERELRSDHAGETGAVYIYKGLASVAAWRGDTELLAFAHRHGKTEADHLLRVEHWLAPQRRSRLLSLWRVAGWLTGALPALAGRRAVYATIASVETFVDQHYQQQIDHLQAGPDAERLKDLLVLLQDCQADEREHRDESAALAGMKQPLPLKVWCAVVAAGSSGAVVMARRI
jgi:demethoxyubiquinone hydroxylase (CLK1/Coq7/Cat5 family)